MYRNIYIYIYLFIYLFISYAKPTKTNNLIGPKEGKPTDPLESILTCADILYSDRMSPKNLLKHRRTKTQLTLHLDQVGKFETHCKNFSWWLHLKITRSAQSFFKA